jgi:thiol-disulfide isomerase/thioredoxin
MTLYPSRFTQRWAVSFGLLLAGTLGVRAQAGAARPAAPRTAPSTAPTAATSTATLTGKVSSPTLDSVAVSLRDNPLDPREKITYARLNEKGEFKIVVGVSGGTKADLVYGDDVAPLYLDPGSDIDVRFKGEDMATTLKFKPNDVPNGLKTKLSNGSALTQEQRHRQQAANANNYLAEADAQFVENDGFQVLPDNIQLYEAPFISFLEYRRKHELNFLEDHAAKQSFTPEFYNYAKAEVTYAYANDKLTFQDLREQVVNTESRLKMSPTYYDFLNDPALLNNPEGYQSELYHEFLLNYVHYATITAKHLRTDPDFYPACYALASKQLTGPTRAIVLGRILQESFRFGHVRQSEAMLADFKANADPKKQYYATLKADFDKHRNFAIGAPAPAFRLPTAAGDSINLKDFQGKLVYLNFWKSTNGLCLRDLAYAQDLMRRFEGKNIVFVNVALDENEQAWRQLVTNKKLPGVQVRATGGLRSALAKVYSVQEVPTYYLLGEDGTFLNTKPKRLSSRAAIEEINQSFGKASTYMSALSVMK